MWDGGITPFLLKETPHPHHLQTDAKHPAEGNELRRNCWGV